MAIAMLACAATAAAGPRADAAKTPKCGGKKATIKGTKKANRLKGTRKADVIAGLGGNDTIKGLAGNDIVCGGAGNDKLRGNAGRDKLIGGKGKDNCLGGPGRDTIRSCETGDVKPVYVAPTVSTSAGSGAWVENAGPVPFDSGVTVSDIDSLSLQGATVRIASNHVPGQDQLGFANQLGITGTYNDTTGTLTLSGTATLANYQTALRSVTYGNSSDTPSTATRALSVQVTDTTALASNTGTRNMTLAAANDAPTVIASAGSTNYSDGDPPVVVDPALAVSDPDDANLESAVVRVSQGFEAGDELLFVNQSGITGTYDSGTGVLTLTGTATPADYQAALRSVQFDHTGSPTIPSKTIEFTASDGDSTSAPATKEVGPHPAPVATTDSYNAVGNTGRFVGTSKPAAEAGWETSGSVLDNDTNVDAPGSPLHAEPQTNAPTTAGGTVTMDDDGHFTYQPQAGDTGPDSFTYRVCDASPCNSATNANSTGTVNITLTNRVWYVKNNAAAGGDGTSDTPYDTLAEAEISSGANDTTFVYDGDNTTTGYTTGYAMAAGERLLGEAAGLSIDPDGSGGPLNTVALLGATAGAYPTLTANNEDVVDLDDANEVRGFTLDPQGTGGGIAGAAGDTGGGTVADVRVLDTGTAGTQPGIELDGTTGTFNFQDLTVSTNGATAVRLNNAGTARFASTGTISLTASGAKGLDATGTSMGPGSVFDDITVTGSSSGGVSMTNTTGTTTLGDGSGTDLQLTTASGATPAFQLANAGTVSVPAGGTADISATGGPAVDVSGTSGAALPLDAVSSTNSSGRGVNLDGLGAGTFSAASGSIGGATLVAFRVNGGSGDVTYPGNLNNGAGDTASVTGRTGGTVTLSGNIADTADAGGGVSVTGNSGGSTVLSGATKTLDTGASGGVVFDTSDGHTLTLSGGGLGITTGAGNGLAATNSGTLVVSGSGNTISTGSGRALNVGATDIGASGLTFQSIASNGSVNGISLSGTGSAGSLTVTGSGSSALGGDNSGGTIQNTTGPAISLAGTSGPSFRNVRILNTGDSGINGTAVDGFTFKDGRIDGAGDADDENSITFDDNLGTANVTGAVTVTNNIISDTEASGVDIQNSTGTISDANISGNTLDDTGDVLTAGSAVSLVALGGASAAANVTKAELSNNTITDFRAGAGFVVQGGNGTNGGPAGKVGTAGSGTDVIAITGNFMNGGLGGIGNQPDRFVTANVHGVGQGNFDVSGNGSAGNRIQHIDCIAIELEADGPVTLTSKVQNNFINANSAVGCAGIAVGTDQQFAVTDAGTHTATISGNNVMGTDGPGIYPIVRNSASTMNVKVQNNTVAAPTATNAARAGIRVDSGSASGDTTLCLNISGNTTAGSTNTGTSTTSPGINLRKQGTDPAINSFAINGMAATSSPGVENYVNALNTSTSGTFGTGGTALLSATTGFTNCSLP